MAWTRSTLGCIAIAIAVIVFCHGRAGALQESNVLVVYNVDDADSVEIANYYQSKRPGVSLLGLTGVSNQEQVTAEHYLNVIRPQVLAGLDDEVDAIVTTKGLPLRIEVQQTNPGTYDGWRGNHGLLNQPIFEHQWFTTSSLESELMRIDRIDSVEMMGDQAYLYGPGFIGPPFGPLWPSEHQARNPYYDAHQLIGQHRATAHPEDAIRLSTRLDGFDVADVKAMIDRAQPVQAVWQNDNQTLVLDGDPVGITTRIAQAGVLLDTWAIDHEHNDTAAAITDTTDDVLFYAGLGTNDSGALQPGYIANQLGFNISDGAVFHTYESYNARSFDPDFDQNQALVAEWIEAGGTAALGHVWEGGDGPANVSNEDVFLEHMLHGYTFAEAFAASTFQLSYINTAIGDPLMRWTPQLVGDANLDGKVSVGDLDALGIHFGQAGVWAQGDFTGDNMVTLADLNALGANFMANAGGAPAAVPEPDAFVLVMLAAGFLMLMRRDHHPAKG